MAKATIILFKTGGKYYTEEQWEIPEGAIGPYDMERSKDFRRIGGGPVLVESQEPWGYPHLFPAIITAVEVSDELIAVYSNTYADEAQRRLREVYWAGPQPSEKANREADRAFWESKRVALAAVISNLKGGH